MASLRARHRNADDHGALAWRALFDGQGVLWTLEAYAEHRRDLRKSAATLPKARIELAYDKIRDEWIPKEFEPERARRYWDRTDLDVADPGASVVKRSYKVFATQAFQVGVLMAFAYLKKKLGVTDPGMFKTHLAKWIEAFNAGIRREGGRRAFDREPSANGFMSCYFGSLQPSDWYWFRYFTFEMLAHSKVDIPGRSDAREAAQTCRGVFLDSFARAIQSQQEKLGQKLDIQEAGEDATKRWREVLKTAIGLSKADFNSWNSHRTSSAKGATVAVSDEDDGGTEEDSMNGS